MNHSYKSNKKKKSLRLDPALRAALTLLIPSLLLRVLTAAFAYTWLGVLLQLLMYILCGYMAASAYYESIRREFPRGRHARAQSQALRRLHHTGSEPRSGFLRPAAAR